MTAQSIRIVFVHSTAFLAPPPRASEIRDQCVCFFWSRTGNSTLAAAGFRAICSCVEIQPVGALVPASPGICASCRSLQGVRYNGRRKTCGFSGAIHPSRRVTAFIPPHPAEGDPSNRYTFRIATRLQSGHYSREFSSSPSVVVSTCHALHGEVCTAQSISRVYFLGSCQAGADDGWLHSNFVRNIVNITDVSQVLNICEVLPKSSNSNEARGNVYGDNAFRSGSRIRRCVSLRRHLRLHLCPIMKYVRVPMSDELESSDIAQRHVSK